MQVSSRTPEGEHNHCPICHAHVCIEPSHPPGDAPCPHCGSLLWFGQTSSGMRCYDSRTAAPLAQDLIQIVCENLGVNRNQVSDATTFLKDIGADSLDIVELMMELEEEFEVEIPDEDAERMKTIGDVVDYIERHRPRS